jgi:hypothetical protein
LRQRIFIFFSPPLPARQQRRTSGNDGLISHEATPWQPFEFCTAYEQLLQCQAKGDSASLTNQVLKNLILCVAPGQQININNNNKQTSNIFFTYFNLRKPKKT